ncbi:hypothetical protein HDZ31DRAFT_79087 [Schizophyllum fasciatum]
MPVWKKLVGKAAASQEGDVQGPMTRDRAFTYVPQSLGGEESAVTELATYVGKECGHLAENCTLILKALDAVSEIHPFIQVAVLAFRAVISLEVQRQENNQKVLLLWVQMKDMMAALQHLRDIPDSEHVDKNNMTIASRLKPLTHEIAQNIIACKHECDNYTRSDCLVLKCHIYEQRLAEFGERFAQNRTSIDLAISLHTTVSVGEVKAMVTVTNELLSKVLRLLDTPREREIMKEITRNGGPEKCLASDDALEQLMRKEGTAMGTETDQTTRGHIDPLKLAYSKKELQEYLEGSLNDGFDRFLLKLKSVKDEVTGALQNFEASLRRETDRLAADLTKGPHERIIDKQIHALWKEMHWRNSVKAHHFTLSLRDHLIEDFYGVHDGEHAHKPEVGHDETTVDGADSSKLVATNIWLQDITHVLVDGPQPKDDEDGEHWAIKAFTLLTTQAIAKTLDDDGTGFVSTWEVNFFTTSRPADWSLLRWLIYWGEGWYASLRDYRHKILRTMQNMYGMLDELHPINRGSVDMYLHHPAFQWVECLMRGLDTSRACASPHVLRRLRQYTKQEEKRLRLALKEVGYEIDDAITLQMVKGRGRIERYIFPLLYLILRHHLDIIRRGDKTSLDDGELIRASQSLYQLMQTINERILRLKAAMRHTRADGHPRLTSYAFGMFQHMVVPDNWDLCPEKNVLQLSYPSDSSKGGRNIDDSEDERTVGASDEGEEPASCHETDQQDGQIEDTRRGSDAGDREGRPRVNLPCDFDMSGYDTAPPPLEVPDSALSGAWTGTPVQFYLGTRLGYFSGLFVLSLLVGEDDIVTGSGHCAPYDCSVIGTRRAYENGNIPFDITLNLHPKSWMPAIEDFSMSLQGVYRADSDSLLCSGSDALRDWELVRTPPDIYRFRRILVKDRSAGMLWNFARHAILHRVRRQLFTRQSVSQRLQQMLGFVYSSSNRRSTTSESRSRGESGTGDTKAAGDEDLKWKPRSLIPPEDARFYLSIVTLKLPPRRHYNALCNICDDTIVGDRYACLHCIDDGLKDQIDLCTNCRDQTPSYSGLTHRISHTLIRIQFHMHDKDKKQVYDSAREALKRVKQRLARHPNGSTPAPSERMDTTTRTRSTSLPCAGCGKDSSLPCYYCASCYTAYNKDVVGCEACLEVGFLDRKHYHNGDSPSRHYWILVREETIRPEGSAMEAQWKALEEKLNARIELLERKLDAVLAGQNLGGQ